jgi:hypothetical protein
MHSMAGELELRDDDPRAGSELERWDPFRIYPLPSPVLESHGSVGRSLQSHMNQVGADVLINFDASDQVTLQNVQLNQLMQADFLFS